MAQKPNRCEGRKFKKPTKKAQNRVILEISETKITNTLSNRQYSIANVCFFSRSTWPNESRKFFSYGFPVHIFFYGSNHACLLQHKKWIAIATRSEYKKRKKTKKWNRIMQGEIFEKEEEKITNYHKKSKCREKVEKREPNSLCVLF